jgi:Ni,Fe-hydrogenase III small subunit
MINSLKIFIRQGRQYIPDIKNASVPGIFRGRPVITSVSVDEKEIAACCPTGAVTTHPLGIDMGKCAFCGECARLFPGKISFTRDYKIASNRRDSLIIKEGADEAVRLDPEKIRKEISRFFRGSLKLRQVSAGGDNSNELELNACGNVNFDMGRFGIEFVASPRHADGIVITGPISENMAEPLQICYDAIPDPKIIILAGVDAIGGGIFTGSPAIKRDFLDKYKIDLYIPGNHIHQRSAGVNN